MFRPPKPRLCVLITNVTLASRTGTELYVRDLAQGLLRRGHCPVVYSTRHGALAAELRQASVPVLDDLVTMTTPPDIIHGHHHHETMTALLHFPGVPALYVFHDSLARHSIPPHFPRILQYVAVDETCHDRMLHEYGVPLERSRVLFNAVDLHRFKPRPPLPPKPRRALVFSNNASELNYVSILRRSCSEAGITLEMAGFRSGTASSSPEKILGRYDLVFARARCALEAMAVGAAVILCDAMGAGDMVTSGEFDQLRSKNFGRRTLIRSVTVQSISREIGRYDAADASEVSRRIRCSAGLETLLGDLEKLYGEVVAEQTLRVPDCQGELRATAAYLRQFSPPEAEVTPVSPLSPATLRQVNRIMRWPLVGSLARRLRKE